MRDFRDGRDVLHFKRLRSRGFCENGLSVRAYERVNPGADCRVIVARLDPEAPQSLVGEGARRLVDRIRRQQMVAGAERGHQRNDDGRQSGGHEHGPRRARKVGPGGAQSLGRRRAAGAVGKSLRTVLERRDIRIEHGRATKRWHVDEALRELSVAAEIHEARAAPQGRARFIGEFGHRRRASSERRFGPLPSMLRGPWQPIDFRPRRPTMPQSSWARVHSVRVNEEVVMRSHFAWLAGAALSAMAVVSANAATLDQVKTRGQLICGANPGLAGCGLPDDQGTYKGLDVDECKAIAAAIFNDPNKVKYLPINAKDRPTILLSGEIDVLIRNTTWTLSRQTAGMFFTGVNYYDGQGFMVRKKLDVNSALKLDGASVCVQQGTTTELNLADYFRPNNMKLEAVVFATDEEATKAYDSGRCDAYTTDASGLYSERLKMSNPDDHIVLPEIISKEPLGPSVRKDDIQWFQIVQWTHYALITAEELGVTQANVDEKLKSDNPAIRRLLGVEGSFGQGLGLTNDWAYRIIKHVGNYGESFERNVGMGSPIKISRGLNALWNKGGLQYAPPIR